MGLPADHESLWLDEVDSTMAEARRRARGPAVPTWICARRQTAAHGRRGRAWVAGEGNFAATLLMHPACAPAEAALRSFTAAVAVAQALETVVDRGRVTLKWPNDVLLDSGKVAGILLESGGSGGRIDWLAVGIGVNLVYAPAPGEVEPGAVPPTSVAASAGWAPTAEAFLPELAHAFATLERQFSEQGFAPIRHAWLARAARLNRTITARTGQQSWTGRFVDVDGQGRLVLDTGSETQRIAAADVYF